MSLGGANKKLTVAPSWHVTKQKVVASKNTSFKIGCHRDHRIFTRGKILSRNPWLTSWTLIYSNWLKSCHQVILFYFYWECHFVPASLDAFLKPFKFTITSFCQFVSKNCWIRFRARTIRCFNIFFANVQWLEERS